MKVASDEKKNRWKRGTSAKKLRHCFTFPKVFPISIPGFPELGLAGERTRFEETGQEFGTFLSTFHIFLQVHSQFPSEILS